MAHILNFIQKQEASPRETKKQPDVRFKPQPEEKLPASKGKSAVDKTGNRVTYKDLQVPRIIKRTSNLSVEPQYGSDSSFRIKKKKPVIQANKRQTGTRYFLFHIFISLMVLWFEQDNH